MGDAPVDYGFTIVLSEAYDDVGTLDAGGADFNVPGFTVNSAFQIGGPDEVIVGIDENGLGTEATPDITLLGGAISDAGGATIGISQTLTATDGAPPAIIEATTFDSDVNGQIDRSHNRPKSQSTNVLIDQSPNRPKSQ